MSNNQLFKQGQNIKNKCNQKNYCSKINIKIKLLKKINQKKQKSNKNQNQKKIPEKSKSKQFVKNKKKYQNEFDITQEILSSKLMPSNIPTEAIAGKQYSSIIIRKENTIKIVSVDENLNIFIQAYTIPYLFEIADVFGNVVVVNQYNNNNPQSNPVIAFYFFNHNTPTQKKLTRRVGYPWTYKDWKAITIVQIGSTSNGYPLVFVLLQRGEISQWNVKDLYLDGSLYNGDGQYLILNKIVDFGGGDHFCQYDKTLNVFYRVNSSVSSWQTLIPGVTYGNVTFLTNVVYHRLNSRTFAFTSNSVDNTQFHLAIYSEIQPANHRQFEGLVLNEQTTPILIYGDGFKNLIVSSKTDAFWCQCTDNTFFNKLILSVAITNFTIKEQAIKLTSIKLLSDLINIIECKTPSIITVKFYCDNVSKQIVQFTCFQQVEKCVLIPYLTELNYSLPAISQQNI